MKSYTAQISQYDTRVQICGRIKPSGQLFVFCTGARGHRMLTTKTDASGYFKADIHRINGQSMLIEVVSASVLMALDVVGAAPENVAMWGPLSAKVSLTEHSAKKEIISDGRPPHHYDELGHRRWVSITLGDPSTTTGRVAGTNECRSAGARD